MRVRVAYVEEPPFYWTADDGSATGADIELAAAALPLAGADEIEFIPVRFDELVTGVAEGRWEMNVPIFVTEERSRLVAFSRPVWSLGDGFVVRKGNPRALTDYASVAAAPAARIGLIPGQVQYDAAVAAGVTGEQIVPFGTQPDAIAALSAGAIDAFAATAVGNRAIAQADPTLEAIPHPAGGPAPTGAFSFALSNESLRSAVDSALGQYLGTPEHRTRAAAYGIGASEIDGILSL